MKTCKVMAVIESRLMVIGDGTPESPKRTLTQYFDLEGNLLAERDEISNVHVNNQHAKLYKSIELLKDAVAALGGVSKLQETNPKLAALIQGFKLDYPNK